VTDQSPANYLLNLLESGGGTLAKTDVTDRLPFLSDAEIIRIFAEYVPDVRETTVAGIPCWQRIELPANFAEHLKEAAADLEKLGFTLSPDNLNLVLSLRYDKNFRRNYGLEDNADFIKLLRRFSIEINQSYRNGSESGFPQKLSSIIGLRGNPLPESTWRGYLRMWRDPRCREIAEMEAQGIPLDEIAKRVELAPKTVHDHWLFIHHNMPLILEKNGLTEEDIADA